MRSPLPASAVERIRQQRITRGRRSTITSTSAACSGRCAETFASLGVDRGPRAGPLLRRAAYEGLMPWRPVWALDIDRHFGGANVVGSIPLPFRDAVFSVVVCTQALYLVDDPLTTVNEMRRVTMRGGMPSSRCRASFRRESSAERRMDPGGLAAAVRAWTRIVRRLSTARRRCAALYAGQLAAGATRRWPVLKPLLPGHGPHSLTASAAVVERMLRAASVIAGRPALV
jgi:hypothetical protein